MVPPRCCSRGCSCELWTGTLRSTPHCRRHRRPSHDDHGDARRRDRLRCRPRNAGAPLNWARITTLTNRLPRNAPAPTSARRNPSPPPTKFRSSHERRPLRHPRFPRTDPSPQLRYLRVRYTPILGTLGLLRARPCRRALRSTCAVVAVAPERPPASVLVSLLYQNAPHHGHGMARCGMIGDAASQCEER